MALRGTLTHRKTRRLARLLGIPLPCALGLVEALWHVTAEQQMDGGIGRMSDEDIADEMFYDGDPTELVNAFTAAGWIDPSDTCRLIIHDWHEHADTHVHASLAKRVQCFASGYVPYVPTQAFNSDTRKRIMAQLSEAYPKAPWARPRPVQDTSGQVQDDNGQVQALPEPVPDPVPVPVPDSGAVSVDARPPASLNGFKPPTKAECREKAQMLGGDAQAGEDFWLHYDSVGWKVGGNAMVNWQSRLQKWLNGDRAKPKAPNPPSKRPPPLEVEV